MIGYYIHHSGYGHYARAESIAVHLGQPVTALTSKSIGTPHPFADVVALARDDGCPDPADPTAHGVWHWAPHHDPGLRNRTRTIADWVDAARPAAVVVDVSVEVAALVRLLGIPTIVMAMPGQRTDAPHTWIYQMADHILAAWPRELYEPAWLEAHRHKTSYVGGISRFDGRARPNRPDRFRVAVLGCGDSTVSATTLRAWAKAHPSCEWLPIGSADSSWVADPWPTLAGADVVIAHAGQSSVADLAAASVPAIVVPQQRPFDEQHATATALVAHGLAITAPAWPSAAALPTLLDDAVATGGRQWPRWQTRGAAQRAAAVIDAVAGSRQPEVAS